MTKKEKIVPITSGTTDKEQSVMIINKSIAESQKKSNLQAAENLKNLEQGCWKRLQWKNCMTQFIHQRLLLLIN